MRVLAIEPYFGGSHRAFLDGWIHRSRHDWDLFTLPPNKWKWRMRHSAFTMAQQAAQALDGGGAWDMLFCSDMLNLAEFKGLAPEPVRDLPSVAYFHENQLTYPVLHEKEYDYHFAFSNMNTALAADRVWFNSAFHRDSFLGALADFLERMPDYRPVEAVELIRAKSDIRYPGIDSPGPRGDRKPGPLKILWAARWEYDKDPETFFAALDKLEDEGVDYRINVIGGGNAREVASVFENARERFAHRIDRWGYQEGREEYLAALRESDVVVSTAQHEFFGIGVLEAVAAGAFPVLPDRLAYPEVVENDEAFLYEGDTASLVARLTQLADRAGEYDLWSERPGSREAVVSKYCWDNIVESWDSQFETLVLDS